MKFLLALRCLLWTIERRWRPACNVISSTNDALGQVSLNAINFITLGTNLIDLHPNKCSVNLMRNSAGHGSRLDVRLPGMRMVAGSILTSSKTFLRGDLVMKKFLRPFSPFR